MRGFTFFTKSKIHSDECLKILKKETKNAELNGEEGIWVDGKFRSFLWIYNGNVSDLVFSSSDEATEFMNKIPIKEPFVNGFETHRSIDLKRFISAISVIHPELYVYSDDDDLIAPAQEFLNREFDY